MWRLHFFAGVLVAPFLAVLCLTGIAYALSPQLDALVYRHELTVPHPGPARLSLADQVRTAASAVPGGHVVDVRPAPRPDRTTAVDLTQPGVDDPSSPFAARYRTVYVDPTTGQVRGSLMTTAGRPPLQQWLRDLHGNLHLGTAGRLYSELAASWLPFLASGGWLLWWTRRRRGRRDLVTPRRGMRPGRARVMSWHAVTGVWLTVGLLFISLTGLTWSHYAGDRFFSLVTALHGRTPHLTATAAPHAPDAPAVSVDTAVAAATQAGLDAPLQVTRPTGPTGTYTVSEISQSWPIHRDSVAVDPYTGRVVQRLPFTSYPLAAKLTTIGIFAHSGTLFGWVNQAALIAFATGVLFVLGCGYRMWWLRRPTGSRTAAPPPRRAWRALPRPLLTITVIGAAAIGFALPVFGVSLAAFLTVDQLWRARPRRTITHLRV